MIIEGNIVDIVGREIYPGAIEVEQGRISKIRRGGVSSASCDGYIMLGFVDAHLHIESYLLTPSSFSQIVVGCGTVAVVTDPHEIANVMGRRGVDFMIEESKRASIRCHFTIPSSVPATPFDLAGGEITAHDVEQMTSSGEFVGLSEVMNLHGVVAGDEQILAKIEAAHAAGLVVDGHAPMQSGEALRQYIECGITTDHECVSLEEAEEKIAQGMKILIREGSAAKNYEALKPLIASSPENIMFCTDDSHPDDILSYGHIDKIVRRAVADGFDLFDVLRIASINPIDHYKLDQGDLSVGSRADFIVVDDLRDFALRSLYLDGTLRYSREGGVISVEGTGSVELINNFNHDLVTRDQLQRIVWQEIDVIGVIPNEIITRRERYMPKRLGVNLECDLECDIQKIVYINRYHNLPPVVAFCRGFGLRGGAIATSVSHDSHNILAVGCSDEEIADAVNSIVASKGGLAVAYGGAIDSLPLPIAGIMSDKSGESVAAAYSMLQQRVAQLGCRLPSPFMTLSFLSLVVIPELKIGEQGLFSYSEFNWVD
ncbi:MAG: adenine deaminase [Rikenellaceae bacterium]